MNSGEDREVLTLDDHVSFTCISWDGITYTYYTTISLLHTKEIKASIAQDIYLDIYVSDDTLNYEKPVQ